MPKKRVGVIVDWARSPRGNGWDALLDQFDKHGLFPNERRTVRLADQITQPLATAGQVKFFTQDLDVLIINWDVANGDPEFGSHLALRWLEHRRPEILMWVRHGGILIIEGQATLSVPTQAAYDALVGRGELPVCGAEDPLNPSKQSQRMGNECRLSKRAPTNNGFDELPKLEVHGSPTHETMFPGSAADLLTEHIRDTSWDKVLYRGWFRRSIPGGRALPWMSLVERVGPRRLSNHSTMQVACVERGAIFASTMLLATTRQDKLVLALLDCARVGTAHLPRPAAPTEWLRTHWKMALTASAGLATGVIAGWLAPWDASATAMLSGLGLVPSGWSPAKLESVVKALFVPAGMLLFYIVRVTYVYVAKAVRDFIGY